MNYTYLDPDDIHYYSEKLKDIRLEKLEKEKLESAKAIEGQGYTGCNIQWSPEGWWCVTLNGEKFLGRVGPHKTRLIAILEAWRVHKERIKPCPKTK